MRKVLTVMIVAGFLTMMAPRAEASIITYEGCLTATVGATCDGDASNGSLTATASWANSWLSWLVTGDTDTGVWTYQYTFNDVLPVKNLSHMIIEVSSNFADEDILDTTCDGQVEGPDTFGSEGNSNPGIPGDIYGIKCNSTDENPAVFTIVTDRIPVWGDFYAKDGKDGGLDVYAYNAGFLAADPADAAANGSVANHLLVPDTQTVFTDIPDNVDITDNPDTTDNPDVTDIPDNVDITDTVPEPASLLLLGAGLAGAAASQRRRQRKG